MCEVWGLGVRAKSRLSATQRVTLSPRVTARPNFLRDIAAIGRARPDKSLHVYVCGNGARLFSDIPFEFGLWVPYYNMTNLNKDILVPRALPNSLGNDGLVHDLQSGCPDLGAGFRA